MTLITDLYYSVFYAIYRSDRSGDSKNVKKWKASLVVDLLGLAVLATIDNWVSMFTCVSFLLGQPKWVMLGVVSAISVANHMSLLYRDRWEAYANRFNQYPRRTRRVLTGIAVGAIVLVLSCLAVSFIVLFDMHARRCGLNASSGSVDGNL